MLNFEKSLTELSNFSFKELDTGSHMPLPEWMQLQPNALFGFLNSSVSLPGAVNSSAGNFWDKVSEGPGVYDYIIKYCEKTGLDEVALYQKAALQRSTFSKLRNMDRTHYIPSKYPTIICLALAMELNDTDIQAFVNLAGYHLSNAIKPDKIVMYCVKQHEFSVDTVNRFLYKAVGKALLIPERVL